MLRSLILRAALAAALGSGLSAPAWSQPSEPSEPSEPEDSGIEFGWDEGPSYDIRLHELWLWPDVDASARFGATLYLDGGHVDGDLPGGGWEGKVRRARIYTRGRLKGFVGTEYKIEVAAEGNKVFLNDFYLRWRPDRIADTLTVGYMDPPFGLQALVASRSRSLMEGAAPSSAFSPGFRLGVEAAGTRLEPDLSWYVNLSSVGQRAETGDASQTPVRATGRLVWRPWNEEELLHLGLGVSTTAGGDVHFRARPESFLAPYLVDTGDVDGTSTVIGTEAAWSRGPLSAQLEAYYATVDASGDRGRLGFDGVYVQGVWIVTGERREYDRVGSIFRRVVPTVPFDPRHGGRGAVELAARLSWVDLTGAEVRRAAEVETTALGAAQLAGLALGALPDLAACRALSAPSVRLLPKLSEPERNEARARWRERVAKAR